jgi:hypothetical protein
MTSECPLERDFAMQPALLFLDITPETPADRQKLARPLRVLAAEDRNLEG